MRRWACACDAVTITPMLEHRWMVKALRKSIRAVVQPVLIIHPREDDYAAYDNIAYLVRHLPNTVDTVALHDCYHIVTSDQQRDVALDRTVVFVLRIAAQSQRGDRDAADLLALQGRV